MLNPTTPQDDNGDMKQPPNQGNGSGSNARPSSNGFSARQSPEKSGSTSSPDEEVHPSKQTHKLSISRERLQEEYVEKKKSLRILAQELGCTPQSITRWLKKYGIPRHSSSEIERLSPEEYDQKTLGRFMAKVKKTESGCWIWTGHIYRNGYGDFHVRKRVVMAHKFAFECIRGEKIPDRALVYHRCGKPSCVNPSHLEIRTQPKTIEEALRRVRNDAWLLEHTRKRLWSCVDKSNGCWLWTGKTNNQGYGMFSILHKPITAHRAVYELECGGIPKNLYVCHHCDNKRCLNPPHLFVGTQEDNMQDASKKGRLTGKRKNAKLSVEKAWEILKRYYGGDDYLSELAREYGVSVKSIKAVIEGRTWVKFGKTGNGQNGNGYSEGSVNTQKPEGRDR